jgi:uncharacterized coiled-coil DUF342 family protein
MPSNEKRHSPGESPDQKTNALGREIAELEKRKKQLEAMVTEHKKSDEVERLLVAQALNLWHRHMLPDEDLREAQKKAMPISKKLDEAERERDDVCSKIERYRKELENLGKSSGSA